MTTTNVLRTFVITAVVAVACSAELSGCGGAGKKAQESTNKSEQTILIAPDTKASRLLVRNERIPIFKVYHYRASGVYPQVTHARMNLGKTNRALRRAIQNDQRAYAPSARKETSFNKVYYGEYSTSLDRRLMSASTVVVSVLMPVLRLFPDGIEGKGWLSVTVDVASGKTVSIEELFTDSVLGVRILAGAWITKARSGQKDMWEHCIKPRLSTHYKPDDEHFRYFALTPRGVAVGFRQEPACHRAIEVVPYAIISPYLSTLGRKLVAGVRSPLFSK